MKRSIVLVIVLIALASIAYADFYSHCYWVPQGTKRLIAWTAEPGAVGYELQVRRMETGKTVYQARVAGTQWGITWKTPGHYVIYLRWYKLIDGVNTFGEWKNSLEKDSSLVLDGDSWTPRSWVIIVPTTY